MIAVKKLQFPAFLVFWSTVVAVAFFVIRSGGFSDHPDLLSLTVDDLPAVAEAVSPHD